MNIQPNWTVTDQGPWQLIYNDTSIISLSQTIGTTSTEGKVFAGTQEECEAERVRLSLPWASDVVVNPEQVNSNETGGIVSNAVNLLRGLFGA